MVVVTASLSDSVHLEAPDSVLQERHVGKRVDPLTGGVTVYRIPECPLLDTALGDSPTASLPFPAFASHCVQMCTTLRLPRPRVLRWHHAWSRRREGPHGSSRG